MANKLEAIIIDFDDTLIPTTKVTERAMNSAMDAIMLKGIDMSREDLHSAYMNIRKELGSKYKEHLDVMFERLGIPKARANELISAARVQYHLSTMDLMPFHDVPDALHKLGEYKKYLATDGDSKDQWDKIHALQRSGLDPKTFEGIFITEDYQFKTKCPEFYNMILEKTGFEGKKCIMIGDKIDSDIRPARACGIHTVRVLTGKFSGEKYADDAEHVIPRFSDILRIIPEIEKTL